MKKTFAELFKKYRLRAEFEKLSELGESLSQNGLYYEDSIFSHWQKGTRVPHERHIVLKLLELFIERKAIISVDQANELLESTGQGFLTRAELNALPKFETKKAIFQVPAEVSDFTGREDFLDTITQNARKGKVILIYGTAGVGKTTIAIKAAHLLRQAFQDGIFWYRMDTCTMKDMLLSIGHLLKEPPPPSQNMEVLSAWIRSILSQKKILLILDNVEKNHQIHLLLPNTSSSILILSRYKDLYLPANPIMISLTSFTDNEVLALFETICTQKYIQKYSKQLLEIGKLVGNLPLAIQMIAKQLRDSQSIPEDFIRKLTSEEVLLQNISYENKNLYVAIQVSYNNLSKNAQTILLSLGVFEGRDFSIDSIAHINGLSVEKTEDILQELINTSFIEASVNNKLRVHPMIKKFINEKLNNPYLSILNKVIFILFLFFTIFWIMLQLTYKKNTISYHIFGDSYFITALFGGLWGITIAHKWGGKRSLMGKAILLFSIGLLCQTFGQITYSAYDFFLNKPNAYGSIGDIGYFGTIPFYIVGMLFLARASGAKINTDSIKRNWRLLFLSLVALGISYFFVLQRYILNWSNPFKIFLDFGYPLGDIIYAYLALLTYIELKNMKKSIIKSKVLIVIAAFTLQFLTDLIFVIQANANTFYIGQFTDYLCLSAYLVMSFAILQLNSYRFKFIRK